MTSCHPRTRQPHFGESRWPAHDQPPGQRPQNPRTRTRTAGVLPRNEPATHLHTAFTRRHTAGMTVPPPWPPYSPPPPPPKAPRPPIGSQIHIDAQGNLTVGALWQKWTRHVSQCTVQTIDQTGRRVTVTRALTIGLFALGAKKRTGHVTVIVATRAGETKMHRVPADFADRTLEWAVAFNVWHQAVYGF